MSVTSFMGKIADECCPECQGADLFEFEAWRGIDGHLYESEAAEAEFVALAPSRAAAKVASEGLFASEWAKRCAEARVRNARLLPRLRALLAALGDRAPKLRQALDYASSCIERDPEDTGRVTAYLYFEELADLFAPELATEMGLASDYRASREERDAAVALIRPRILAAMPPAFLERMGSGDFFTAGCGLGYYVDEATDGLLLALGVRKPGHAN